jgi:VWFA-related protein
MLLRAGIFALAVQAFVQAGPQSQSSDAGVIRSSSHVVQLHVSVTDASGAPVHGLRQSDFVVTDNGRPRDVRIFSGEIDMKGTAAPGMYSNRLGAGSARVATAIVIDAAPRPEGLQQNEGILRNARPEFWYHMVQQQARHAIQLMQPGQAIAIYAASPELQVLQDFTSDPEKLMAALNAFTPPALPKTRGKKPPQTIEALMPPMLSALRDAAARVSGAQGRKSVIWVSQGYGTKLNLGEIGEATDATINAFSDAIIPLYAIDSRFNATCPPTGMFGRGIPGAASDNGERKVEVATCSQEPDISDRWMRYLARATGGREFSAGKITGMQTTTYDSGSSRVLRRSGFVKLDMGDGGAIGEVLRFAADDARYAYEMGFYVPEAELDGKIHPLNVSVVSKPKFELRYRSGYTASSTANAPSAETEGASPLAPGEVGIDGRADLVPNRKSELQVSLVLAPETVTKTDGRIELDATFTQIDSQGKQLAQVQQALTPATPASPAEKVAAGHTLKLNDRAVLLRVTIRDRASNRVGTIAIPIPIKLGAQ